MLKATCVDKSLHVERMQICGAPDELLQRVAGQSHVVMTRYADSVREQVTQVAVASPLVIVQVKVITQNVSHRRVPPVSAGKVC